MPATTLPRKSLAKGSQIYIAEINATLDGFLVPNAVLGNGLRTHFVGRCETFQLPPLSYSLIEAPELCPMNDLGVLLRDDPKEIESEEFGNFVLTAYMDMANAHSVRLVNLWESQTVVWVEALTGHRDAQTLVADGDRSIFTFSAQLTNVNFSQWSKREFQKITIEGIRRSALAGGDATP